MKSLTILAAVAVAVAGCAGADKAVDGASTGANEKLSGAIHLDGSSTVAPISEAVAEEFQAAHPDVRVTVGTSGTGGGMKKFVNKEIDIADASRPIKPSEFEAAQKNGVEFIEIPVGYDGLSVVVNPENTWVDYLTVEELKRIWEPNSKINNWSQVRPSFPNKPLKLYGPGQDSGTFDYFTDAIVGKEGASRQDFTGSEDDNVLVMGIAGDPSALGYFGFSYYEQNMDKLKIVPIKADGEATAPSKTTIQNGTYAPLSRPLFIYVRKDVADRPEVAAFVKYYLSADGAKLVEEVKYIPLPENILALSLQRFEHRKTGSVFHGKGSQTGVRLEDLMKLEESGS